MADPRNELADIAAPVAPLMPAGGGGVSLWVWVTGAACGVGVALLVWLWRRRRPVRALRAITRAVARQQDSVPQLAARLDAWTRAQFCLTRLDAANSPQGLDPAAWSAWVDTLLQLRFAPPRTRGHDALADLCRTAQSWRRHA